MHNAKKYIKLKKSSEIMHNRLTKSIFREAQRALMLTCINVDDYCYRNMSYIDYCLVRYSPRVKRSIVKASALCSIGY